MSDPNSSGAPPSAGAGAAAGAGAGGAAMPPLPPHTEWWEHTRAVWPFTLAIVFEAFAITAVALRIWSLRLSRKQKLADHDWAILVALVSSSPLNINRTIN